jgi:hypothetical protein
VTLTGNITLAGLSNGLHSVIVYARDAFGNVGASEIIAFTIAKPEPFLMVLIIVASVAGIVLVSAGLIVYFKKFKKAGRT